MLKKILIGAGVIILIHQAIITYRYYTSEPITITEEKHEETQWQDNQLKEKIEKKEELTTENNLVIADCYIKPVLIVGTVKDDTLYVEAGDGCKSSKAAFRIQAINTKHHIIQAGITFRFYADPLYEIAYLYDFSFITIGGGILIDRYNPGLKLIMQKRF